MAARLFDQAVHHTEPQPGALARRFGGEEGLENKLKHIFRDAAPRVGDSEHDVLPRLDVRVTPHIAMIQQGIAGFDRQLAMTVHGVPGVYRQIQDRVLDLGLIDKGVPQAARDDGFEFDAFPEATPQHVVQPAHETTEVDDRRGQRLFAAEC